MDGVTPGLVYVCCMMTQAASAYGRMEGGKREMIEFIRHHVARDARRHCASSTVI